MIINNLAGEEVEITDIKRFLGGTEYDISDIYFGDKHIFESWRELESPLPITILAAGEDLLDYRIYGNTENGESVGERTANLFDKNSENNLYNHSIRSSTGEIVKTNFFTATHKIDVTGGQSYVAEIFDAGTTAYIYIVEYDEDDQFVKATSLTITGGTSYKVITLDAATTYVRMSLLTLLLGKLIFVPGSTAPTSYIPYGYQLPMVVRSRNLWNPSTPFVDGKYIDSAGTLDIDPGWRVSDYVDIDSNKQYTFSVNTTAGTSGRHAFYNSKRRFIRAIDSGTQTFITPNDAAYARFSYRKSTTVIMLTDYRDEENIYIGSDPLAEDEYVDFGEQKIYRMVSGTLTPTDPPVPIPALPTIDGETIIDYNPSETPAVEPEKMYVKFKP